MVKSVKQRYSRSRSTYVEPMITIIPQYELQYNSEHIVEKVYVGDVDIVKEVASHIDEVGMINAIRLAIARGQDPSTVFGKYEDGIPVAIDPNITKDDLTEEIMKMSAKKAEIAKTLGISLADFDKALKEGTMEDLIKNSSVPETVEKEGDE